MAVTQLLARVPPGVLRRCRSDGALLGQVVSFAAAPRNFYLDLDWAPAPLRELLRCARQTREARDAFARACDGVRPVNGDYPEDAVEALPRELDPAEVRAVNVGLQAIDADAVFAVNVGVEDCGRAHLRERFDALRRFYAAAAAANQAVIVWWD